MTVQNLSLLLIMNLLLTGLAMQLFQEYYQQKRIAELKAKNETLTTLRDGLNQLLSIKEQIGKEPDDNKQLAMRYDIVHIIQKIHPLAEKLGYTDILEPLEDEFNEQYKYIEISEMIKKLESNPPNHRNYNEVV